MQTSAGIVDVANAIQLALAPVFLLTGIAGLLNVMTGRLARIIDRARALTEPPGGTTGLSPDAIARELQALEQRRHFTSIAIMACTAAALLLCTVIVALFLEVLLGFPLNGLIGLLFTSSTFALVIGLAYFFREVQRATQVRIALPESQRNNP
jgi:hypothetical protein